jgi:hypothetical protein
MSRLSWSHGGESESISTPIAIRSHPGTVHQIHSNDLHIDNMARKLMYSNDLGSSDARISFGETSLIHLYLCTASKILGFDVASRQGFDCGTSFPLFGPRPSYSLYLPDNVASKCSRTALTAIYDILLTSVNVFRVADAIDSRSIVYIAFYSLTIPHYLFLVFTYAYSPSPSPSQDCLGIELAISGFKGQRVLDEIIEGQSE